jgi:hypothetical protein
VTSTFFGYLGHFVFLSLSDIGDLSIFWLFRPFCSLAPSDIGVSEQNGLNNQNMLRLPISERARKQNGLNNQNMLRSPISEGASEQNGLNNQNMLRSPIQI